MVNISCFSISRSCLHYLFVLCILLFSALSATPQGFLRTNGKIIENDQGEVILRGMGLGGWMLMEGYMMQSSDVADTQHEFREKLENLMGTEKTDEFFNAWLDNHVTKKDVDSLALWGYNSIRLPMHYNLFTLPIEEEPVAGENTWLNRGFELTDNLLAWCKENSIYLILDLHGAPGGQGENAAISDYDPTKPSLWESKENRDKTVALWKKIAERYKDEIWIGGYDLINETNWYKDDMGPNNALLRQLMGEITDSIRSTGDNHIVFIEGNSWANDFNGMTPPWDDNMVYSFHKYWSHNDQGSIKWVLDIRDRHNVPLWMGEAGENSNVWFTEAISLFEQNGIGWSWWPMKRVETIVSPYSIKFTEGYKNVLRYWRGEVSKPSVDEAYNAMMELALNSNSVNCDYQKDVHDAKIRQPHTDETIPYITNTIPGRIHMSDFDMGKIGYAYFDIDYANYSLSTGSFGAWNNGWQYRNDGVDIQFCNDNLNSNGYNVGWTSPGEWMQYTVQVEETAAYRVHIRYASSNPSTQMDLDYNGVDITGPIQFSSTGGWQNWRTYTHDTPFVLGAGEQRLKLKTLHGGVNLSYFELERVGDATAAPFKPTSASLAGNGAVIKLALSKSIDPQTVPSAASFSASVNGANVGIEMVEVSPESDRLMLITLVSKVYWIDLVFLNYSGSTLNSLQGDTLSSFNDLRVENTLPARQIIPKRIQAQSWVYQEGLSLEKTNDTWGEYNFGYTNAGDFADYLVTIPQGGQYIVNLRVATPYSNGKIRLILIDDEGESMNLTDVSIPRTGGWQTWQTISETLTVPEGHYNLRLFIVSPEFNVNWIEFDHYTHVKAADQKSGQSLILYPNPASSSINLSFTHDNTKDGTIRVVDTMGRVILQQSTMPYKGAVIPVQTNSLSPGMYSLIFHSEGEIIVERFMIIR